MATHNKTIKLIASKLGMADEDKVLRKAAEFERLLQAKSTAGSNISDTSKVVICLDLAAVMLGVEFDTKSAIKFSGLKPSMYTNSRKVVENLLELNSNKLTIQGVCVKLQCSGVQALAEHILKEYKKQAKMEIDLNLPQYVCMAVYQACRLNKVKASKAKLLESSRLKPAQWSKLEAHWTKVVDENFADVKKKRGRAVKTTSVIDEKKIDQPKKGESCLEPQIEPYEDWKKRILETAYKELGEIEASKKKTNKDKIEEMKEGITSPKKYSETRSPRKNSKLISPRKSQDSSRKVLLSPIKKPESQSLRLSPRKLSQCLKENIFSPGKDLILSPVLVDLFARRSPRKSSLETSPSKTNSKKGVRLLFPREL